MNARASAWIPRLALLGLSALTALPARAAPGAPEPEPTATWQHHHSSFSFFAVTSIYTCDGLEDKVKQILRYLGARKKVEVLVQACARGPTTLTRNAYVTVDFDALETVAAPSVSSTPVRAQWSMLRIDAQHPFFIDAGDCELLRQMRPVLTEGFSWRNLSYETSCTPYDQTVLDIRIRGEVLKPATANADSTSGLEGPPG